MTDTNRLRILFLCARFPYPPFKGDQARAYHQIRLLADRHRITLLSFAEPAVTPQFVKKIRPLVDGMTLITLGRRNMAANLARRLSIRMPAQTAMFTDSRMRRALQEHLRTTKFDLVHIQLARMASYLEKDRPIPCLVDLIDAISVNMARRASFEPQPKRFLLREEGRRLKAYERSICDAYDAVTVVSQSDRIAIGDRPNLFINANGVDLNVFRPRPEPRHSDQIVMTGNMGYFPNVDGLRWFASEILPEIQRRRPNVCMQVVGVNPSPVVRRLAETNPAIKIIGFVPDLAAYLATATLAIVPLRSGSGMQFKIIEAMACGTPVVATTLGIGGLNVQSGYEILVANDPTSFADAVCRLLVNGKLRDRLAHAGRRYVIHNFSWRRVVSELEELYQWTIASKDL